MNETPNAAHIAEPVNPSDPVVNYQDGDAVPDVPKRKFDIAGAFSHKQAALEASFLAIRNVTTHPGSKGDVLEADWVGLIRDFLPTRYEVGPIFAVDHTGAMSDQIDVAIYDKHFSPQWFGGANGLRFVPVESVYAVFEVKPELNAQRVQYAIKKVASVRNLARTSATVVHKGGRFERSDIQLRPIIGGILTDRNAWNAEDPLKHFDKYQPNDRDDPGFLNIGIVLDNVCFDYTPTLDPAKEGSDLGPIGTVPVPRTTSQPGQQLIHFAIRLFRQLQAVGSVPAVDMETYEKALYTAISIADSDTEPAEPQPTDATDG